jgi:pilus assembly protein Flp/PilA
MVFMPGRYTGDAPDEGGAATRVGHQEQVMTNLMRFIRDEQGATAIEYGLIAAGISVVIIGIVNGIGSKLASAFSSVESQLK